MEILKKYPNKIPVIVLLAKNDSVLKKMEKNKFIFPSNLTFGQSMTILRKRLEQCNEFNSNMAIFAFVNNTIPPLTATMAEIYKIHKSNDLMLYITLSSENTFGSFSIWNLLI